MSITNHLSSARTQRIRTRFAPSPTGNLHLGSARTALFNWLYAKHYGGEFLLRIEDTDQARSTDASLHSILDGLSWLGLTPDFPPIFQSQQTKFHAAIAKALLDRGKAYWCNAPEDTVTKLKAEAREKGVTPLYPGRDASQPHTSGAVLRAKMPRSGSVTFHDQVQGPVTVSCDQLDDLVLLRADGTPTYMLAAVADDKDMEITHVIRGTDHLSNTPKQLQLYHFMDWTPPLFAHIPLIHGADGAKLSKRHGALDIGTYKAEGFLPEALRNALLRLGFGCGDQEFFTMEEATRLFDFNRLGQAAARFDPQKLLAFNAYYLREKTPEDLLKNLETFNNITWSEEVRQRLVKGLPSLAARSKTLKDLSAQTTLYTQEKIEPTPEAKALLTENALKNVAPYVKALSDVPDWSAEVLEAFTRNFAETNNLKLGELAKPLRTLLSGQKVSPPLFEMMAVLGKSLTLQRLSVL